MLWDHIGLPDGKWKQVFGHKLNIIGFDINPHAMSFPCGMAMIAWLDQLWFERFPFASTSIAIFIHEIRGETNVHASLYFN